MLPNVPACMTIGDNQPVAPGPHGACPLCGSPDAGDYAEDKFRKYAICRKCALVFVPGRYHIPRTREKAQYDTHCNRPYDPAYRKFLSRLFNPLRERLPEGAAGLDFGCGPGPALAAMCRECGYSVDVHDKFYAPVPGIFEKRFDFITATEVVEHLHRPGFELHRLYGMLREKGILGIMTKLVKNRQAFRSWHYTRDPTHICFFSRATFGWLAKEFQAPIEFIGSDVILIHKA